MISKKDWKEFKKWRFDKLKDWYLSDVEKSLDKQEIDLFKPRKCKFLFWERDCYLDPGFISMELKRIEVTRKLFRPFIPKETIEECLNWLERGKK